MTASLASGVPFGRGRLPRALAAVAALLALASPPAAPAAEPGRLLVWINGDKGYNGLQRVGDAFTKVSGIRVTVEHPEDAPSKFQQATAAGKGPDIWCWAHDRLGEWVQSGLVVPVHPSPKLRAGIDPLAWQAFTKGGRTWGYPLAFEAITLIYNRDLVKTPPADFDALMALDRELRAKGRRALLYDYAKAFFSWPLLAANGGYPFGRTPDGDYDPADIGVNNAGALKGAQLLGRLLDEGFMPRGSDYASMEAAFARGEVAMTINGPWAWDNVRRANIRFGVAPIPAVGGAPAKPFVAVLGCMIAAPSPNKDLAREFLEHHLLQPEGLKTVNADVPLGMPANLAFAQELSADPHIAGLVESVRRGVPMPSIPEMGRFWAAMNSAVENIVKGRQAPREALDAAATRMSAR